jgi:hypothetical protein
LISGVDHLDHGDLVAAAIADEPHDEENDEEEHSRARKSVLNGLPCSALYLIAIPQSLQKKTYGALFQHLARDGIIPLGLLRGIFANMSLGPKSNKMPYVFTNPDRESEVFVCDRVFVLSTVPMEANRLQVKVDTYYCFSLIFCFYNLVAVP